MVAQPGAVEQTNLQTSVMEHAACMRMADSYADHYASYMNMDQFVRQCWLSTMASKMPTTMTIPFY